MKVALALSGGGARGIFHAGVLKAFNEGGLEINIISGTSSGAIIGALFAQGYSPEEIRNVFNSISAFEFLRFGSLSNSLISAKPLINFLERHLPGQFSNLKIPLIVEAVSIETGEITYFDKGDLIKKLLASSSLPGIMPPVNIDGQRYIDGGVLDNLPITPLEKTGQFIVGVNSNSVGKFEQKGIKSIIERTMLLTINRDVKQRKKQCDFFIESPRMSNFRVFDIKKSDEMFDIGYETTKDLMPEFLEKLKSWTTF